MQCVCRFIGEAQTWLKQANTIKVLRVGETVISHKLWILGWNVARCVPVITGTGDDRQLICCRPLILRENCIQSVTPFSRGIERVLRWRVVIFDLRRNPVAEVIDRTEANFCFSLLNEQVEDFQVLMLCTEEDVVIPGCVVTAEREAQLIIVQIVCCARVVSAEIDIDVTGFDPELTKVCSTNWDLTVVEIDVGRTEFC